MIEFYQGTPDTAIERLCRTIAAFDSTWLNKCVPATDEQIQQLEDICCRYGYTLPWVYLDYLCTMGVSDGGLLEREWDGCMEPSISNILELFNDEDSDAIESLQSGLLLFSYHWTTSSCYLRVDRAEDNPVVTTRENQYFAGSFEKYLFQKAFEMYQNKLQYHSSVGTSINTCDAAMKKHSFTCSVYGGTVAEKMKFARWLASDFQGKEAWFSDDLHYISYNEHFALEINLFHSLLLTFSCDDPMLKKSADAKFVHIFN